MITLLEMSMAILIGLLTWQFVASIMKNCHSLAMLFGMEILLFSYIMVSWI